MNYITKIEFYKVFTVANYRNKNLVELVNLAKQEDASALEEIVRRYQQKIYNSFCSLNPACDLSDLTQDALVKMSKSIKNLKNPLKFNSWLQQIVHNLFFDFLRKKNRSKKIHTDNPIDDLSEGEFGPCVIDARKTPDQNTLACELKNKINKAIDDLPPLFKTIVLLREIDGLSYEEIAKLTKLNIGTVKSRLARARIKLKNELEPYLK